MRRWVKEYKDHGDSAFPGEGNLRPEDEGWLYLATVADLFNREIVGWSLDSTMTRKLVIDAFNTAINKENPDEGLIFIKRIKMLPKKVFEDMFSNLWL